MKLATGWKGDYYIRLTSFGQYTIWIKSKFMSLCWLQKRDSEGVVTKIHTRTESDVSEGLNKVKEKKNLV